MLYYCPLEEYKERYTCQWSAPITGWLERNWIKHNIPYVRISSPYDKEKTKYIKTGTILDAQRRTDHCFSQVSQLIKLAYKGKLTSSDIIYFDDFWHLGVEALSYTLHQLNISPKMFSFLHAQSVDIYDFTYPMRDWMRHFERGIAKSMTGIFVNSQLLKKLLIDAKIGDKDKIHVIGHVFSEEEVKEHYQKTVSPLLRTNNVVFSSRWDMEKNPSLFLLLLTYVVKLQERKDITFTICTSSPKLKSNDKNLMYLLNECLRKYPDNLFLLENLSKEDYYNELRMSKIQVNTADQDWISIALLEASMAGCYPLYPNFRSFPQAFRYDKRFLYKRYQIDDLSKKVIEIIDGRHWSKKAIKDRAWIHERHNDSWGRMINIMFNKKIVKVRKYE